VVHETLRVCGSFFSLKRVAGKGGGPTLNAFVAETEGSRGVVHLGRRRQTYQTEILRVTCCTCPFKYILYQLARQGKRFFEP
jgi:hypothetical protein